MRLRRILASTAIALAIALGASHGAALEPPMSEAQMTAKATAIARVEVERVECLGPPEQEGSWEVTRYRATLRRIEALKGATPERFELLFAEIDAGDDIAHSVVLEPGWRGRVFLVGGPSDFSFVEWNGAISDPESRPRELPRCGGCGGCGLPARGGGEAWVLAAAALLALRASRRGRRRLR
jgi:hypothetical protein